MWGYGPGWGHMYGWGWIMPLIGIVFMVVFLLIIYRIFSSGGGFCGHTPADRSRDNESIEELKKEIRSLRDEIRELKNNNK